MSEERQIPAACLGWSRVESLVQVVVGAASRRCWLELYRDPSCLIGEVPESRKEVSTLAYNLSSTVLLQYSFEIELELGVPSGTWNCPTVFQYHFHPAFFWY